MKPNWIYDYRTEERLEEFELWEPYRYSGFKPRVWYEDDEVVEYYFDDVPGLGFNILKRGAK